MRASLGGIYTLGGHEQENAITPTHAVFLWRNDTTNIPHKSARLGVTMASLLPRLLNEYEGEEYGEEYDSPEFFIVTAVIAIVLLMIAITFLFEKTKHHLEHICAIEGPHMSLVLEKLFGEMTVLGFLSLTTFVVTKMRFFDTLNDVMFHEEDELLEIVEMVHFAIFFVMVFYVFQVLVFVKHAISTEHEWTQMDRLAFHRRHNDSSHDHDHDSDSMYRADKEQVLFEALRHEFILERDAEPPFSPTPEEYRVTTEFSFGRYLSISLGQFLAHAVELDHWTLAFIVVAALAYYVIEILVEESMSKLAWTWVAIGWAAFIFNLYFERHVRELKNAFAARKADSFDDSLDSGKSSQLLDLKSSSLPAWCDVNLDMYMDTRPRWRRWCVRGSPNRQQTLYWMDRQGPKCYLIILQINLIFAGLYCAVQFIKFVHVMRNELPLGMFLVYLILAFFPIFGMSFTEKNLVRNLSLVCSIGVYRRPQAVSAVLREEKTAQVVRSFIVLHKLRQMGENKGITSPTLSNNNNRTSQRAYDPSDMAAIGRTFDTYDRDGNGSITYTELQQLMSRLSVPVDEFTLRNMVATLDADKDGRISREEFLKWYTEQACNGEDDMSDDDRAEALFCMFDLNLDMEITIGEFKQKVDALRVGLSVDDVGAIVHELDTDNNGTIGLREFKTLVKKYYPKELK